MFGAKGIVRPTGNQMFTTRRKAIKQIREATNLSSATVRARVNLLPRTHDGCREKVSQSHVRQLIAELNNGPRRHVSGEHKISPLSEKHKAQIRAYHATKQTIDKLKTHAAIKGV